MIVATTPALSVSLPDRFHPGQVLRSAEAAALQAILTSRIKSQAQYWLKKGLDPAEVARELELFALTPMLALELKFDVDPVDLEAQRIARALVLKRIPADEWDDKELAPHILFIASNPAVRRRAEEIVQARQKAVREALGEKS